MCRAALFTAAAFFGATYRCPFFVCAAAFAAWPLAAKVLVKTFFALPFTFHSFNGIRHLMWDFTIGITNKQVAQTGWAVVGLSVVSALGLAFL